MSDGNLFTGHGGPMPKSRVLNAGFFGTVDDAFSSRSLNLNGSVKEKVVSVQVESDLKEEDFSQLQVDAFLANRNKLNCCSLGIESTVYTATCLCFFVLLCVSLFCLFSFIHFLSSLSIW